MRCLSLDVNATQAITTAIACYIATFFERQLAYKMRQLNTIQKQIVQEYMGFLSEQMREIGVEIDSLRARSDLLFREADISDVIQLIRLSGCALPIGEKPDAQELLVTVNSRIEIAIKANNDIERYSLQNIRTILEERVSFLAEIRYISWVVEQKIQLSKELNTNRVDQAKKESKLETEADALQKKIEDISVALWDQAKKVRFYMARPLDSIDEEIEDNYSRIKDLRKEIADCSKKKKSLYEEKEEIQQDLDRMKEDHSTDSFRWDRLRREKRDLTDEIKNVKSRMDSCFSEIESLGSDISELKSQRTKWIDMRNAIYKLMRENDVPLVSFGDK